MSCSCILLISALLYSCTVTFLLSLLVLKNTTGHRLRPHDSDRGCDFLDQSWCLDIPKINLPQFLLGPTFVIASFCASSLLCQTMFSKVLGPWPQVCVYIFPIEAQAFIPIVKQFKYQFALLEQLLSKSFEKFYIISCNSSKTYNFQDQISLASIWINDLYKLSIKAISRV